ncbi:MAG: GAP family protein, partial [Chloroflexi bacterium]|nr:GAP family protein [Chloroflexota bacterium]
AVGVLALAIAVLVGTGLAERFRKDVHSRGGAENSAEKVNRGSKVPQRLQRAAASESPWLAWGAGVTVGMPSAYYLAAIAVILGSGVALPTQIGALLVFNIVRSRSWRSRLSAIWSRQRRHGCGSSRCTPGCRPIGAPS